MNQGSINNINDSKSYFTFESENKLLSKLRIKSDEIKKLKTAINSLTDNKQLDNYSNEIDFARSQYNSILNKLNSIRARNKKNEIQKKQTAPKDKNNLKDESLPNKKFNYMNHIANKKILPSSLLGKSVIFDTYVF